VAIIKLGALVSGIRGTLGGVTYSANATGPYVKSWAPPAQPRTVPQATQRGYLSQMPGLWRALSSAQWAAWDTFAALPAQELTNSLGEAYYISGFAWFCKLNLRLYVMEQTLMTAAPTGTRPAAPTIAIQYYDDNPGSFQFRLTVSAVTNTANSLTVFTRAIPASGRQVNHAGWFNLRTLSTISTDPRSFNCSTQHLAEYGEAVLGWRIFVEAFEQTTEGQRSAAGTCIGDFA